MTMDNARLFEVDLQTSADEKFDEYAICIKAMREPFFEEAKQFLKSDMEKLGYSVVAGVYEITKEEAEQFYDLSKFDTWPVFE